MRFCFSDDCPTAQWVEAPYIHSPWARPKRRKETPPELNLTKEDTGVFFRKIRDMKTAAYVRLLTSLDQLMT